VTVVSDTSVLRYLSALRELDLLGRRFGEILVPSAVADECSHPSSPEALRTCLHSPPDWLRIEPAPLLEVPGLERLDPGESAAVRLALARNSDLVLIDERIGRQIALSAGLEVAGTLGLLADAAARGWLDFDAQVRYLVAETNFRVAAEVLAAARRRLDESNTS
jgi:predicted nucleic acid-binding protein